MTALLVTDPDCGFCQRSAVRLARWFPGDWRNAPANPALLERLGISTADAARSVWYVELNSDLVVDRQSGARAVLRVVGMRFGFGWFARLISVPPMVWFAEAVYRLIARNRHLFAADGEACAVE